MTDGVAYAWKVRGYDGTDYSTSYTVGCQFTVDTVAPSATTVTSTQYPAGAWSPTAGTGTFSFGATDVTSGVDHYLYSLDTPTPNLATAAGTGSLTVDSAHPLPGGDASTPVPDGWHTLYVAAVDKAGNIGPTASYSFGAAAGVTSPADGTVTNHSVTLGSRTGNGPSTVTYYYRRAAADNWTTIPTADVTASPAITGWPYSFSTGSGDAIPPAMTWNAAATLGADGPAQIAVCFGTSCPTSATATLPTGSSTQPINITLDSTAFDVAATQDITPGSVNLLTGNFQYSSDDADVPGNLDNTLSVGRTLNTATVATTNGIFGPGWTASLPVDAAGMDYTGLTDTGSVLVATYSDQSATNFGVTKTAGTYAPTGPDSDSGLTVTTDTTTTGCSTGSPDYRRCYDLTDLDGDKTVFQSVNGGTAATLPPAAGTTSAPVTYRVMKVTEPGSANTTTFTYNNGDITRIISPVPTGASCTDPSTASTWSVGCRGLDLAYDGNGHLTAVTYDTSDGTNPLQIDVACYTYNSSGQLTDEWDPRDMPTAGTGTHPIVCGTPVRPTHYDYDSAGRIAKITPDYAASNAPLAGWSLGYDSTGRLSTVTRSHLDSSGDEVSRVFYDVDLTPASDASYRPDMRTSATSTWAQTDVPDPTVGATAICPPGASVTDGSGDLRDCTLSYLDADGRAVNTADYAGTGAAGWHITTTEYDAIGHDIRDLSAADREEALDPTHGAGAALGLSADTAQAALDLSTVNVYTPNSYDGQPDLTATFGPYHQVDLVGSTAEAARSYTAYTYDATTADGDPETGHPVDGQGRKTSLHLVVKQVSSASLSADAVATSLTDSREVDTRYYTSDDTTTGWTFVEPMRSIVDPGGLNLVTTTKYDPATGRVTKTQMPSDTAGTGAGTAKTIYYRAGTGSGDSDCDSRPLWDGLVCKTTPANATPTSGLPSLVTAWYQGYDYLGRPTTVIETATPADGGSAVSRTTATVFGFNSNITDGVSANPYASTVTRTSVSGGVGTAVPAQTTTYSTATGLPTSVSNGSVADSTGYDDFGRVTSYNENTSVTGGLANPVSTSYDPTHGWVSSTSDAHTSTSYSYNGSGEHRGLATGASVTVAGTSSFTGSYTASYTADGEVATETDPNGITMTLGRDENGQLTSLVDTKTGAAWLSDTATVGISGQWRSHSGPAGSQLYSYDAAGRLTESDDTPTVGVCTIRSYGFDADSNRTTSTVYPADATGGCQTVTPYTGGSTTSHSYDAADRLLSTGTDSGVAYDTFGRITTVPGADTNTTTGVGVDYYTNDLVHAQTVGSGATQTVQTQTLDAEGRFGGWTTTVGGTLTATKSNHYDDASSESPDWIAEDATGSSWIANITDLTGGLGITVDQSGTPTYTYADLHGDVVATAPAGAAKPTVGPDYDEFGNNPPVAGVDADGNPTSTPATNARYGWLGAKQRSGDDQAGLILMGVRLYDPALGRFLQTDPISGGSANAYDYAAQDGINNVDLDGRQIRAASGGGGWSVSYHGRRHGRVTLKFYDLRKPDRKKLEAAAAAEIVATAAGIIVVTIICAECELGALAAHLILDGAVHVAVSGAADAIFEHLVGGPPSSVAGTGSTPSRSCVLGRCQPL